MDNTNKAAWDTLNYGICACNAMSAKSVMMGYTKSAKVWAETGNGLEFMREAVRGGTFGYYETKPEPLPTADADQALSDILSVCDCCHGGCMARERIEALRGRLVLPRKPLDTRPELDPEKLTDEQCEAIFEAFTSQWPCNGEADSGRKYARAVASVCRLPAPLPEPEAVPDELLEKALLAWETGRGGRTNSMRAAYRVFRDWLMGGGGK